MSRASTSDRRRLQVLFKILFVSLTALPLASRPKAKAFDGIGTRDLARAYADQMARMFAREPDLGLFPPTWLLRALDIDPATLTYGDDIAETSIMAAERAADRDNVVVTAL